MKQLAGRALTWLRLRLPRARLPVSEGGLVLRQFIHMPKTAGTSLRNGLQLQFGAAALLCDYGPDNSASSKVIRRWYQDSADPEDIPALARSVSAGIVCGHFGVQKYGGVIGLANSFTFVREPVARVYSHFGHAVRIQNFNGTLQEFIAKPRQHNLQFHNLGGLDPALFAFVGITEDYANALRLIKARFGWNLELRTDNPGGPGERNLDPELAQAIAALNPLDLGLYARARHLFSNALVCLDAGRASEPRAGLDPLRPGKGLSGWGFLYGSNAPLNLAVVINGQVKDERRCQEFRPLLAGWGVARHGYMGFSCPELSLQPGDRVQLHEQGTGLVLDQGQVATAQASTDGQNMGQTRAQA